MNTEKEASNLVSFLNCEERWVMKRLVKVILIIVGVCLISLGALYFTLEKVYSPKFPGTWQSTSENEGCFSEITFSGGTPSYQGINLKVVKGNHTTVYMGGHKVKGDKISVEINNFDNIAPFDMTYEKKADQLDLSYNWGDQDNYCTYTLIED